MSPTSVVIALILCGLLLQYALGWRQARRFSHSVAALRAGGGEGDVVSVGVGKYRGRRCYVAVLTDPAREVVTSALVMSGATVFAGAQPCPALVGVPVADLAAGEVPQIRSTALSKAAAQAAEFARTTRPASALG